MAVKKKTEIKYYLSLEDSKFKKSLAASTKQFRNATRAIDNYTKKIGLAGAAAAAVAAGGFYALTRALSQTIDLANEQLAAEAKLAAVVKATGGAAGLTADEMNRYAGELQSLTTYGDEVTISAMAILATFKNIKGENFKLATRAAQDMSTVLQTDLKSSILQIGKALNDPIKGISALSRAGVSFTESQKATIKALQESGDLIGAQKIILKELAGEFGGAAAAARNTFGGAMTAAKNALGDLKEQIGFAFTKNSALIQGLHVIEEQFSTWTSTLDSNKTATQEWARNGAVAMLDFSANATLAGGATIDIFNSLNKTLLLSYTSILRLVNGVSFYAKVIPWLSGNEKELNRIHKNRLELQYKIQKSYEDIMASDQAAARARSWAEKAAEKIEQLKTVVSETKIDPSQAITGAGNNIEMVLKKVGKTWIEVAKESSSVTVTGWKEKLSEVEKTTKETGEKNVDYWLKSLSEMSNLNSKYVTDMIAELKRLQAVEASTGFSGSGSENGAGGGSGYRWGGLVSKFALGGLAAQRFARGGRLPGFGGGDRIPALLEAGEFIVRKESVARYGVGLFSALNKLHLPDLPKFTAGGPVLAGAGSGGDHVTMHFSFPGESSRPAGKFTRADAEQMLSIMERIQRTSYRLRSS